MTMYRAPAIGDSNRREFDAHHLLAQFARLEPGARKMRNVRRIGIELGFERNA
jgi:hypothetical protein